jgi:hypothetical protein
VHPQEPQLTLPIRLSVGRHNLRILADNLGRFNLTAGWVALWHEAVFAGEAIAGALPAAVCRDAGGISLDNFAFHGPSVWLLREFVAVENLSYILERAQSAFSYQPELRFKAQRHANCISDSRHNNE